VIFKLILEKMAKSGFLILKTAVPSQINNNSFQENSQ
jgi:hypothetical protein